MKRIAIIKGAIAAVLSGVLGYLGASFVLNLTIAFSGRALEEGADFTALEHQVWVAGIVIGILTAVLGALLRQWGLFIALCLQHFLATAAGVGAAIIDWHYGLPAYFFSQGIISLACLGHAAYRIIRVRVAGANAA